MSFNQHQRLSVNMLMSKLIYSTDIKIKSMAYVGCY